MINDALLTRTSDRNDVTAHCKTLPASGCLTDDASAGRPDEPFGVEGFFQKSAFLMERFFFSSFVREFLSEVDIFLRPGRAGYRLCVSGGLRLLLASVNLDQSIKTKTHFGSNNFGSRQMAVLYACPKCAAEFKKWGACKLHLTSGACPAGGVDREVRTPVNNSE